MTSPKIVSSTTHIAMQLICPICMVAVLLMFILPAVTLADSPEPPYEGPEKCAECHAAETEAWQNSPHARAVTAIDKEQLLACQENLTAEGCNCLQCHTTAFDPTAHTYAHTGVTCEACHGPYVADHPQKGVMQLDVDSSVCSNCHTDTYKQWQTSLHGQAGVQCIGCHLSHSQEFRLTDEALCSSCHRQEFSDFSHTTHKTEGITCTNCHLSQMSTDDPTGGRIAPSHSFNFASQACVNCHEKNSTQVVVAQSAESAQGGANLRAQAMGGAECPPELINQLKTAEQNNKFLHTLSLTGLGLGVGIGGMLGVVAMVVIGYVYQARRVR